MTIEDIKKLVEKYPNDQELGSKVREEYWSEHDKQMRELLDLPSATDNNPKGTSDYEPENEEETKRFPGNHTPHWRTGV